MIISSAFTFLEYKSYKENYIQRFQEQIENE